MWHPSSIFENSWPPYCQIWIIFTHLKLWIVSADTISSGWKFRLNNLAVKGLTLWCHIGGYVGQPWRWFILPHSQPKPHLIYSVWIAPTQEVPTLPIFAEDFRFLCLVSAITIPNNNLLIFAWTTLYRPNIQCCNTILIPLCVFRGKNGGNDGGITAVFSDINTAFFHSFNSQSILLTPYNSANVYIDNMYQ